MIANGLSARIVLATNSRKTIEAELRTRKFSVKASVPIGTSRGKYEVVFLPVDQALASLGRIKRMFIGKRFRTQEEVDGLLHAIDKTPGFKEIGGNVSLAISSVFLKAFAMDSGQDVFSFLSKKPSVPKPISIVAGGWKGQSDIQEFHFLPISQKSFFESISTIADAYYKLGDELKANDSGFRYSKNIESGWVTSLHYNRLLALMDRIAEGSQLRIGLDVAASQLWDGKSYVYSDGRRLPPSQQVDMMEDIARSHRVSFIEDPFHEDDFASFARLTERLKDRTVCGDDLFTTNLERLRYGLKYRAANAVLIKPNQIGTITDTVKFVEEAKRHKMVTVMSHRSSECDDVLLSHLAAGMGCDYMKIGISGDRVIKINELIRIGEKLT